MQNQTVLWQAREILYFTQESFCLKCILNDIDEQDTSFLDPKHKHLMKRGAPPDKVGVLHCLLPIEFHCFTRKLILRVTVSLLGPWSYLSFFSDGMGPFNMILNATIDLRPIWSSFHPIGLHVGLPYVQIFRLYVGSLCHTPGVVHRPSCHMSCFACVHHNYLKKLRYQIHIWCKCLSCSWMYWWCPLY